MNPETKPDPNPAAAVVEMIERSLTMAATWIAWDGRPCVDDSGERIYTPHKAIRRITDHTIDHLAEVEALLSGAPTMPDEWHASLLTFDSDWARFTEGDLSEARQRLRRLARTFELRFEMAGREAWDAPRTPNWSLREIAEHLSGSVWYAQQVQIGSR